MGMFHHTHDSLIWIHDYIGGRKMKRKIEIYDEVKDIITGFEGTVVAISRYMYGCTQILVQPKCDKKKEKEYPKAAWIDEPQLKIVKKGKKDESKPRHGGIRDHP